ncbi:MAG: hypothetical protein KBC64_05535 [Simkaniaceae bacterium]|nr:hypothetical protein [Simkaniaceae bacterium]
MNPISPSSMNVNYNQENPVTYQEALLSWTNVNADICGTPGGGGPNLQTILNSTPVNMSQLTTILHAICGGGGDKNLGNLDNLISYAQFQPSFSQGGVNAGLGQQIEFLGNYSDAIKGALNPDNPEPVAQTDQTLLWSAQDMLRVWDQMPQELPNN